MCEVSEYYGDNVVLIDTWWNVNKTTPAIFWSLSIVLIDTWWNVNYLSPSFSYPLFIVLIDTWWNVNISSITKIVTSCLGFNRYMVECEYGTTRH